MNTTAGPLSPHAWHDRAMAAEMAGDPASAEQAYLSALAQHPDHADLLNAFANLQLRRGNPRSAADLFGQALNARPDALEFALNRAVALSQAGEHRDALAVLEGFAKAGERNARYHSTMGNALRGAGRLDDAAMAYDRALELEPARARALHGRARTALERAETDAVHRYDRALQADNRDPHVWLGKAQALEAAGDIAGARSLAEQLVAQGPGWHEGVRFLAQLRLGAGEDDFTSHITEAARRVPTDEGIAVLHGELLAGIDRNTEAAEVIREARARLPDSGRLALLDAIYSGAAGDDVRADAIFSALPLHSYERHVQEARHRIRLGQIERAEELLDAALTDKPWDISAWALRGIAWRVRGDDRARWLHEQDGLFALRPLEADASVLEGARKMLHRFHDQSVFPLSQSLRGGTQTRGRLFDRMEDEMRRLADGIRATLEVHRAGLPPLDETHPLLRLRDTPWRIEGSWSVRLHGGGDHHAGHIHPQGILSSALYVDLPEVDDNGAEAMLELGRPPADLRLDLGPITRFRPKAGHLALFPSTLYHGTTPFGSGMRMTVAFDVTAD